MRFFSNQNLKFSAFPHTSWLLNQTWKAIKTQSGKLELRYHNAPWQQMLIAFIDIFRSAIDLHLIPWLTHRALLKMRQLNVALNVQRCKQFHFTPFLACDYLSMLWLRLNDVSKRGPFTCCSLITYYQLWGIRKLWDMGKHENTPPTKILWTVFAAADATLTMRLIQQVAVRKPLYANMFCVKGHIMWC